MIGTVVIVDDEKAMRGSIEQWLGLSGFNVVSHGEGTRALADLTVDFDGVVISDVKMPAMDGLAVLAAVQNIDSEIPVILITGHGDVAMAVGAMKKGAYDFLEKPFSPERLLELTQRAQEKRRLVLENRSLRKQISDTSGLAARLVGTCSAMEKLRGEVTDLSGTNVNVLLLGETGSGKEVIARCLHDFGPRAARPFQAVNCGAIPDALFESELFGHEAGAFTGARTKKIGAVEASNGGTLFLDEVTSLKPDMQVKLLRVLQERQVTPVGSNTPRDVDIRLVSAANTDISAEVETGRFRQDFYYRINTIEIRVPPLRDRSDDVVLLFEHFLNGAEKTFGRPAPTLTATDLATLRTHPWPGNVRELRNVAERLVLGSRRSGTGVADFLGSATSRRQHSNDEASGQSLALQTAEFERAVISRALRHHRGNISAVLDELELPRRTLNDKMAKHGLNRRDIAD